MKQVQLLGNGEAVVTFEDPTGILTLAIITSARMYIDLLYI